MGEGAVLFCCRTWQTHILTPSAAIVVEALREVSDEGTPVPLKTARDLLKYDLELDPDTPAVLRLLRMLTHIGVVTG